jgi:hypothetical protein
MASPFWVRRWAQRDSHGFCILSENLRDILWNVGEWEERKAAATRANWGGVRCGQTVCLESLSLSEGEVNPPYLKVRWLSNS